MTLGLLHRPLLVDALFSDHRLAVDHFEQLNTFATASLAHPWELRIQMKDEHGAWIDPPWNMETHIRIEATVTA